MITKEYIDSALTPDYSCTTSTMRIILSDENDEIVVGGETYYNMRRTGLSDEEVFDHFTRMG